jgi:NADH dehydrogenase
MCRRVVIVGAGFAGIAAARELANSQVEVTLVDTHNFHTFLPLLYEVATAGLDPADVAFPIRAIFSHASNVKFRRGRVDSIVPGTRAISLSDGSVLPYDALIVATGATASYFSIEGAAEFSRPLYTLEDARGLRNALLVVLDDADAHPERHANGTLSFVVIGGGATGVEMAGAIVELLDVSVQKDRLRIDRARTSVIIIDAGNRLLGAFGERASKYAYSEVSKRGIQVRLGASVSAIDKNAVHLSDGSSVRADLVVWAGGVTVEGTFAATLPAQRARAGRVVVGHDLSIPGHPEIFVVGDAAAVPKDPGTDDLAPQLAQVALQSGRHVARQIVAALNGSSLEPFSYKDKGAMATIGRRAAVAQLEGPGPLRGVVVKGTVGWFSWLGLHLIYLVGVRNRVVVLLNWFWRYVGWASGPRIILEDELPD